jgi:hypothetical protein
MDDQSQSSDGAPRRREQVPMNHGYSGGKRQREADRLQKQKEKAERLRRNREMRSRGLGGGDEIGEAVVLPEVNIEDIVLAPPPRPKRGTVGPLKLFVGGLSWDTTTDSLREAFAKFGPLTEALVIQDRDTGRSRGFGFVTFENAKDGEEALKTMSGAELDGRRLKVNRADAP